MKKYLKLGALAVLCVPLIGVISCSETPATTPKKSDSNDTTPPKDKGNVEDLSTYALYMSNKIALNDKIEYHKDKINISKIITNKDIMQIKSSKTLADLVKIFLSFDKTPGTINKKYSELSDTQGFSITPINFAKRNWVLDLSNKSKYYYKMETLIKTKANIGDILWFNASTERYIPKGMYPDGKWICYTLKQNDIDDLHDRTQKDVIMRMITHFMKTPKVDAGTDDRSNL